MKKRISIFAFFSGIGILDFAFERSGYNVVFVNEFEFDFMQAYKAARQRIGVSAPLYGHHNDNAKRYAKRRGKQYLIKLMEKERRKGNLVGFIGGPPCPDFSFAGKNAGATGKNGKLTKTYFDIICRCKPDFFLFENVKGLVRTKKHRMFYDEMRRKVIANDYMIDSAVVNALAYGVPQFRERCFMVGIHKSILAQQVETLRFAWDRHSVFKELLY